MTKGDTMLCALLDKLGNRTGAAVMVQVREIRHRHTGEPQSVRVNVVGREHAVWVQPSMLKEVPAQ